MNLLSRIITAAAPPDSVPHEHVLRAVGACYRTEDLLRMLATDYPEVLVALLEGHVHGTLGDAPQEPAEPDRTLGSLLAAKLNGELVDGVRVTSSGAIVRDGTPMFEKSVKLADVPVVDLQHVPWPFDIAPASGTGISAATSPLNDVPQEPANLTPAVDFDLIPLLSVILDSRPALNVYLHLSLTALAPVLVGRSKDYVLTPADCRAALGRATSTISEALHRHGKLTAETTKPMTAKQADDVIQGVDAVSFVAANEVISALFNTIASDGSVLFNDGSLENWMHVRNEMANEYPGNLIGQARDWFTATRAGKQLAKHVCDYMVHLGRLLRTDTFGPHAYIVAAGIMLAHSKILEISMTKCTIPALNYTQACQFHDWVRERDLKPTMTFESLAREVRELLITHDNNNQGPLGDGLVG